MTLTDSGYEYVLGLATGESMRISAAEHFRGLVQPTDAEQTPPAPVLDAAGDAPSDPASEVGDAPTAAVEPAADPVTRQVPIFVSIPNASGRLIAGLFAEGRVSAERRRALVVPEGAVVVPQLLDLQGAADGVVPRVEEQDDGRAREDAVKDIGTLLDWIGRQRLVITMSRPSPASRPFRMPKRPRLRMLSACSCLTRRWASARARTRQIPNCSRARLPP